MIDKSNDWFELREFAGVDLLQSFVLSWEHAFGALRLDIDLCLLPDHPFYETPRPSEGACIRAAMLEFPNCTLLAAGPGSATEPAALAKLAASLAHGQIEGLERVAEERYEIRGRFGQVTIGGERPLLRLKDSGP